jgi:hypothetical protein
MSSGKKSISASLHLIDGRLRLIDSKTKVKELMVIR